jgi:uncharacterized membrane protein
MMGGFLFVLTLLAALGCAMMAGVFFAFSSFVLPALRRLPVTEGIAAMQSINVLAVTPLFMAALFGTGVACLGLGVWAFFAWDGPSAAVVLAGCALYLVGTIGVTIAANVPLNDRLAKLDPRDADAGVFWGRFVRRWSAWNHVRTVAALAAAALLTVTLPV